MMIKIAVADFNQTYCQGLKTMLGQVDDFRVDIVPQEYFGMGIVDDPSPDILLVDADLYESFKSMVGELPLRMPEAKTILLTMGSDELPGQSGEIISLKKGSGKKDFEELIRKLNPRVHGKPLLQGY